MDDTVSNTKITHVILQHSDAVAYILSSDFYGKVIVFFEKDLDLTLGLEIYDLEAYEVVEDINLLDLITYSLPKTTKKVENEK